MENFIIKGDEDQWTEALTRKKSGDPEDNDFVQIKVNVNTKKFKGVQDVAGKRVEATNKKKRKAETMKSEKKLREKR